MVCLTAMFAPTPIVSRYRVADNVNLPLRIIPAVQEEGRSRVSINLKLSAAFSYKLFGSNIVVKVCVYRGTQHYGGACKPLSMSFFARRRQPRLCC